jgi:TolB protein
MVINADGTGRKLLSGSIENTHSPAWSPNGKRIALEGDPDGGGGGDWDIYVVNADGSSPVNLTHSNAPTDQRPRWSPNGRWIVFESRNPRRSLDVHTIRADGKRHRNLTRTPHTFDGEPTWSADGRQIVFSSARDGNVDIYVMSPTGKNSTNLTNDPPGTRNAEGAWSP